jgi:capsule biosynthesis phosphatase
MKRLIVDLDNTITLNDGAASYADQPPNRELICQLRKYAADGFEIVIFTSRNMRTYSGNVGKINKYTLPIISEWLERHDVPYDEIIVGKPWCGHEGFYIDDRAIRPKEFIELTKDEVEALFD